MATPMGPPVLPSFSLRVQLFASNAHGAGDRPIRCFRVVSSPDVTIRGFCQEASRIHEINYGEPIAIKKCQDDQEFDVTQSEIVGNLFTSTATIRVIQASPTVNIRDSVPPNSALRYDPAPKTNLKRRRGRGGSALPNGAESPTWNSNKRQRLSGLDPDQPIPSRERDVEASLDEQGERIATTIPNSQQSVGRSGYGRAEIPNSVSPSPPPPALLHGLYNEKRSTDQQRHQPATQSLNDALSGTSIERPSRPAVSAPDAARSKSASYHIERATERGTSVSTAATSPLSADQQLPPHNQLTSTNKRSASGPAANSRTNGKPSSRSPNEDTIYDEIESDSGSSAAIFNKTKASLKFRNSPLNGGPGHERANKFNTPPNGNRRNSRGSEQTSAPELPLTPSSRQREVERQHVDDAKIPHKAAAEAADRRAREASEQKRREAEETRQIERATSAELTRLKKEQEREAAEKRATVNATAARLEKERREKLEREKKAEEDRQAVQKRLEEVRLKRAKEQAEKLEQEKQARVEKQKQDEERVAKEKAEAEAEAERRRKEAEERKRKAEEDAAEELRKSKEKMQTATKTLKRKSSSASVESARSGSQPRLSPAIRPLSSTPFIPTGRKSALKSSQAMGSSPMPPRISSPGIPKSSSQIVPPSDHPRRVSFNLEATPIMSSKTITPKSSKLQKEVPPEKQSRTPILPPASKFSKDRSTTPILPPKQSTTSKTPPADDTPRVAVKSASPVLAPSSKNSETSRSTALKETPKSVDSATVPAAADDTSSGGSDSEEDAPDRLNPAKILNAAIRPDASSLATATKPDSNSDEQDEEDQDEDVEMTSGQSTPPETRSPVVFNHHTTPLKPVPLLELSQAADEAETQSASESSSDEESEESSEEEDEGDEMDDVDEDETGVQETSTVQVPRSSLDLSRVQPSSQPSVSNGKPKQRKNHISPSSSDKDSSTQDAIDYQLTSSMYEANASSPLDKVQKPNNTSLPDVAGIQRPKFKIGASLQSLNASKNIVRSNQSNSGGIVNGSLTTKPHDDEDSGSESGEETESSSDSESEDEESAADAFEAQLSQARSVPLPDSDFESSSNVDSDEEYRQNIRNELAVDLAQMAHKTAAHVRAVPGPKQREGTKERSRLAGKDIVKAEKKKRENKYLTGYSFSQVK